MHIHQNEVAPFDFHGLAIIDYTRQFVDSASLAHIAVPPHVRHPTARSRRSDKLYYCLAGPVSFVVQDKEIGLAPSDLLVIARGEWFSYVNATDREARLLLVHVPSFDLAAEEFR